MTAVQRAKKVLPPPGFAGGEAGNRSPTPPASPFSHPSQPWYGQAACRGTDVEVFFVEAGNHRFPDWSQALRFCRNCPVREECLEAGINEEYGIWGGVTANQRKELRRQRRRQAL